MPRPCFGALTKAGIPVHPFQAFASAVPVFSDFPILQAMIICTRGADLSDSIRLRPPETGDQLAYKLLPSLQLRAGALIPFVILA